MNVKPICSNGLTSHSRRNTPWEKKARKVGGSEISERRNSNERKACREHIQIYMVGFVSYICFLTMMFTGLKDSKAVFVKLTIFISKLPFGLPSNAFNMFLWLIKNQLPRRNWSQIESRYELFMISKVFKVKSVFSSYLKGSRFFWTMRVKLSPAGYWFDIMKLTSSSKLLSKTDNKGISSRYKSSDNYSTLCVFCMLFTGLIVWCFLCMCSAVLTDYCFYCFGYLPMSPMPLPPHSSN